MEDRIEFLIKKAKQKMKHPNKHRKIVIARIAIMKKALREAAKIKKD